MAVKGRTKRLVMGFLIPVLIIPFIIFFLGKLSGKDPEVVNSISLYILYFSIVFAAIPAFIYTLLMEFLFNAKINNNTLVTALSTACGALTAWPMNDLGWCIFGGLVGLSLGYYLRRDFIASSHIDEM